MQDNVTIEHCIKILEDLLKVAHKCHFDVIASLRTTEAEVILAALKESIAKMDERQNCETCKWGRWYRNGYDITMMDEECGGCCSWNSKWEPAADLTQEGG